jgi:hypothetical protein
MERNITIRKSVRKDLTISIPHLVEKILTWMKTKYPEVNFDKVEYIFSSSYNRSRNNSGGKYQNPTACISTRSELILYDKKSLGIKKTNIFVGCQIQMICALIHELTHHVQYEQGIRIGNELDTTRNELLYLKENHLQYYNKITSK